MVRPSLVVILAVCACTGPAVDEDCDESEGLAPWFAELAFFQAVEVPVYLDGAAVPAQSRTAPLVAGRQAVVRAYVNLAGDLTGGDVDLVVDITTAAGTESFRTSRPLDAASNVDDPSTGFVVSIPAEALASEGAYSVSLMDGDRMLQRFPETGEAPLDLLVTGPLKVHFVPFQVNGITPDTSPKVIEGMRDALMAVYPVTGVEVSVGDPVVWNREFDIGDMNYELGVQQETLVFSGQLPRDVYYYGMVSGYESRDDFQGSTGTSEGGAGEPRAFFAMGAAFGDQKSEDTLIHEMGHMHQLEHVECNNEPNTDPRYPYADGEIGVEGYDFRTGTFVPADQKDMMSYCYPRWISDYHYAIMADHVVWSQTFKDAG
ncbi:MAG: M66 family metalloprotease [Myxococcota bacterium]